MEANKKIIKQGGDNLFQILFFRFYPYWPLFVIFLVVAIAASFVYLRFTTPIYAATATIVVKDDSKGATDAKLIESIDVLTTKKIVENEIEVLRSRAVMKEVITKLKLYTSVFQEAKFKSVSAYATSPLTVEVKDPENIEWVEKIPFSYNYNKHEVVIFNKSFPLNTWIKTSKGTFQFLPNENSKTATKGNYYFSLVPIKTLVNELLSSLSVEPSNKLSTVINLYYSDIEPKRAEDILNEVLKTYNRAQVDNKNALAANTLDFIDERIKFLEQDLNTIEAKVKHFKAQKGIVNLSEQGSLFLQNVADNDQKIASINMQIAALDQVEKYVVSKDENTGIVPSTLGVNDAVLSQLLQKLYDAEIQLEKVRSSTGDNNPIVVSLVDQVEKIRPGILENIKNQRSSLLSSRQNLTSTNSIYSGILQTIPQKEQQLVEINRDQAIKSSVYNFLLQKREETALSHASTVSDNRVIDLAESSDTPVGPDKNVILLVACVIAIGSAVLIVCLKEVFNKKILFRSEIEGLTNVPIVGELTQVSKKPMLVINDVKKPFIAEQFRQIRVALGLYGNRNLKRRILVTSSVSGEGKSFITANLALSIAQSGKKVVLIDLDIRNPKVSSIFNKKNEIGVGEYLEGVKEPYEIIDYTDNHNLFIIPAGQIKTSPTELILNRDFSDLFSFLETSFDYLVIDSSPIDPVSDAYILSEYCDTTLFVVRHSYTPKAFIELLDTNHKMKALKNVKIIFNGVKSRGFVLGRPGYGYGFGYGYQYVYKDRSSGKKLLPVG